KIKTKKSEIGKKKKKDKLEKIRNIFYGDIKILYRKMRKTIKFKNRCQMHKLSKLKILNKLKQTLMH
ncbi:unnamed protein product, partial [Arabidopsis halleri]